MEQLVAVHQAIDVKRADGQLFRLVAITQGGMDTHYLCARHEGGGPLEFIRASDVENASPA